MDEQTLQTLSNALTHLCFRSGTVEELHKTSACLDDETMKILNMDINNRIYSLLSIYFNGSDQEIERLEHTVNFLARHYGRNWEPAKQIDLLMK